MIDAKDPAEHAKIRKEIKFFKKEKKFKKEKENLSLAIDLYWKLAVLLMAIVVIFSAFFGYYLFMNIKKEPALSASGISQQFETVNQDRVNKILEYFSARDKKSNQILNSPSPIVDPSL